MRVSNQNINIHRKITTSIRKHKAPLLHSKIKCLFLTCMSLVRSLFQMRSVMQNINVKKVGKKTNNICGSNAVAHEIDVDISSSQMPTTTKR